MTGYSLEMVPSNLETFLSFEHVNVARGENVVLHEINLSVRKGEHVAILGPNGCGKSTLIKTMICECYPVAKPETRVSIFGRERWDLTELKKRLGVVSAELPGRPTLGITGREAVLTGFFSSSTLAESSGDFGDERQGGGGSVDCRCDADCGKAGGGDVCRAAAKGDDWKGAGSVFGDAAA